MSTPPPRRGPSDRRPSFGAAAGPRRPFTRSHDGMQADRPRTFGGDRGGFKKPFGDKPRTFGRPAFGSRPAYGRDSGSERPAFGAGRSEGFSPRPAFGSGDRPAYKPRFEGGDRGGFKPRSDSPARPYGPRRDFTDRDGGGFKPRRDFGAGGERPAFKPRFEGGGRPSFGGSDRPAYKPRFEGGDRGGFKPRTFGNDRGGFKPRSFGGDRSEGFKPRRDFGDRPQRPFGGDRPARTERPARDEHKSSWGKVAEWYADILSETDDTYQEQVILPQLVRTVKPSGKMIFDLACGEGFFARALTKEGATVTGADIAQDLVDIAIEKGEAGAYMTLPADKLEGVESGAYDAVVCVLAMQNIDNYVEAIAEAGRILKEKGTFHLVLNHPFFRIPKASSWQWNEDKSILGRRIDSYMSHKETAITMHPGKADSVQTYSYHRALQWYIKTLVSKGFVVTGLEEWMSHKTSEEGPHKTGEDAARKEFPMFMAITAQKVA
jgi:ubiquinone/menaquinone biosynthesis C-methylase UbiE